ncbi:hypothetical protein [Modestobacter versicolor]|uniref:hypothetical protein n=1 Tax=Modestobacter versicolor TaxID=429133 RepID=UPI0034DECF25
MSSGTLLPADQGSRPAATDRGGPVVLTTAVLAGLAFLLFALSSVVQYRCGKWGCDSGLKGRLDVEAVGGLPRLFTTAVFLLVAVVAVVAARRAVAGRQAWWAAVGLAGVLLAVAKIVSAHSAFESSDGRWVTLAVSLLLSAVGIGLLAAGARRWDVPGARPVVLALVAYTVVALGLDALTAIAVAAQSYSGLRSWTVLAFLEEFGEALTAIGLLAAVRWTRLQGTAAAQS